MNQKEYVVLVVLNDAEAKDIIYNNDIKYQNEISYRNGCEYLFCHPRDRFDIKKLFMFVQIIWYYFLNMTVLDTTNIKKLQASNSYTVYYYHHMTKV